MTQNALAGTQINWLELARFAAAGEGHGDLERGVRRLATLAAAVHRGSLGAELDSRPGEIRCRVYGRTPQAAPVGKDADLAADLDPTDGAGGRR
jgi:hypothetical protein